MKLYIIERKMPNFGRLAGEDLKDAARSSIDALAKRALMVQWATTHVADDKTFCVYLAEKRSDPRAHKAYRPPGKPSARGSKNDRSLRGQCVTTMEVTSGQD